VSIFLSLMLDRKELLAFNRYRVVSPLQDSLFL